MEHACVRINLQPEYERAYACACVCASLCTQTRTCASYARLHMRQCAFVRVCCVAPYEVNNRKPTGAGARSPDFVQQDAYRHCVTQIGYGTEDIHFRLCANHVDYVRYVIRPCIGVYYKFAPSHDRGHPQSKLTTAHFCFYTKLARNVPVQTARFHTKSPPPQHYVSEYMCAFYIYCPLRACVSNLNSNHERGGKKR